MNSLHLIPGSLMNSLHLTLPSKVDAIGPAMAKLGPLINKHLPGDEPSVDVALQEALANAVIHGNHEDARKKIDVFCRIESDGTLDLIVRDQGPGFNPAAVPDPREEANLLSGHGRGIFLMRALMDDVRFEDGGRQVHMRKAKAQPI